ncbi:MAG: RlmF-related methyltransferase [Candidatus Thorarchaeota archaeon]
MQLNFTKELTSFRQIDLRHQCVPIEEAAHRNPKLRSLLKAGKIDLGNSKALSEYNKTVLELKFGLEVQLPPGHLIPAGCLRSAFIQEVVSPKQSVLEIGTGSSAILAMIMATMGCKVVATEANEDNIRFAKRNIKKNNLEGLVELRECAPDEIVTDVVKENEKFSRIITYPPQYSKDRRIRFHGVERGFGGDRLELIGGQKGYEFSVRMINEVAKNPVLDDNGTIGVMLLNIELAERVTAALRETGWNYEIVEVIAGTRKRYIVKAGQSSKLSELTPGY